MSELSPPRRRLCLLAALAATLLGVAPARGEGPAAEGVVVLRNGNVLAGAVRHAGPFYFIEQSGASLQVSAEQVEMACGSLAEAYELRRRDRVGASADAHLELARWCLRHSLLDQAAREVLDARTRDAGHPALASLDAQIRQMLEIEASRRERAEQLPAAATPLADAANDAPASAAALLDPSQEAQYQFVRSIQPMLIHGCATGGCHQPDSPQQMRLDRWALDGNGNPDRIRRNLDAILAQINPEDPASSPVMLRARQAHGARKGELSKPLATYQAALLLDWLNAAAGVEPEPPMENVAPDAAGEIEAPVPASDGLAAPAKPTLAASARPTLSEFKPRDAFDPELFNRQVAALRAGRAASPDEVAGAGEASSQSVDGDGATEQPAAE